MPIEKGKIVLKEKRWIKRFMYFLIRDKAQFAYTYPTKAAFFSPPPPQIDQKEYRKGAGEYCCLPLIGQ